MHMFDHYLTRNLREGEVPLEIIRRSPIVESGRMLLSAALILGAFFFLFPLLRQGPWGFVAFLTLLLAGLTLAFRTWFVWLLNAFILTDNRIVDIDQRGFFTTLVSSASYEKIQDVSFSVRGVWQTIFQIGTIEIQTAGSDLRLELSGVKHPQSIQERLSALVAEKGKSPVQESAERLIAALERAESRPTQSPDKPAH